MSRFKIISNTGWILLGNIFNKVSSIVLLYILSRYLGADGFGKFSFVFFYLMLFNCIAEMGLTPILIKYLHTNTHKSSEVQGKGMILGLVFTALAIIMAWSGTYIFNYAPDIRYLIFIASIGLIISFRDVTFRWIIEAPFRANLKMAYPVLLGILSEILGLILILFAIYKDSSIEVIVAVYVLSNLPGFVLLLISSIRAINPSFHSESINSYRIIREAFPIGLSNIMTVLYLVAGSLILFHFRGVNEVGYYALAFRLITSLRIIPEAMMHSLFPLLAKAHLEEPQRAVSIFKTAVRYGAFIAFPLAAGTVIVAPSIVVLMSGDSFKPAATALAILIWATFLAFFNIILRFTFNAISLQKYSLWISVSMIATSVLLSFLLIPKYGFVGASYALVLTEGIGLVLGLFATHHFDFALPFKMIGKYLMASLVMAISIYFLPYLLLQILAGIVIYVVINFIIGGFEKEEFLKLLPTRVS